MQFSFGLLKERVLNFAYNIKLYDQYRYLSHSDELSTTARLIIDTHILNPTLANNNFNTINNFFVSDFSPKLVRTCHQTIQDDAVVTNIEISGKSIVRLKMH